MHAESNSVARGRDSALREINRGITMAMFSQSNASMAPPQKPETFMLSDAAQQSLPQDAQVALQQVDNCKFQPSVWSPALSSYMRGCIEATVVASVAHDQMVWSELVLIRSL